MVDIVEFLIARLSEREQLARAATLGPWLVEVDNEDAGSRAIMGGPDQIPTVPGRETVAYDPSGGEGSARDFAHIARHDPVRVLAEVAAQREIIKDYQIVTANAVIERANGDEVMAAAYELAAKSLRMALVRLAAPDAEHPDYNPAWAVA